MTPRDLAGIALLALFAACFVLGARALEWRAHPPTHHGQPR
jgi:hypothetical protein